MPAEDEQRDATVDEVAERHRVLGQLLHDTKKSVEYQMHRNSTLLKIVAQSVQDKDAVYEWVSGRVDDMSAFASRLSRDVTRGPPGYRHMVGELVRLYNDSCRDVERLCAPADRSAVTRKVFLRSCSVGGLAVATFLYRQVMQEDPVISRDLSLACGTTARMQAAVSRHITQLRDKVADLERTLMDGKDNLSKIREAVRALVNGTRKMKNSLTVKPALPSSKQDDEHRDRQSLLEEVLKERQLVSELESQLCRRCPLEVRKIKPPE